MAPEADLSTGRLYIMEYGDGTGATLTPAVIDLSAGGVPGPASLSLIALAAGEVLGRRKKRQ